MRENLDIFDFALSTEEMVRIDALDGGEVGRIGPNRIPSPGSHRRRDLGLLPYLLSPANDRFP
jgi:hypothetical protein